VHQFEGVVNGHIEEIPRGTKGFGYDPLFVPDGYRRTFAQMDITEKGSLSHRGKAIEALVAFLTKEVNQ
jgi:XTP/dITP diphosphohydrolase